MTASGSDSNLSNPANPSNPPSVPELIDDYRREEEALRNHERELDRLRAEVVTAAGREAATIVMKARAEIRDILVTARRELLGLAAQIQVITAIEERAQAADGMLLGPAPEPQGVEGSDVILLPADAGAATRNRVLDARHDVRRVLNEARPDLEQLQEDAKVLHLVRPAAPAEVVPEAPAEELVLELPLAVAPDSPPEAGVDVFVAAPASKPSPPPRGRYARAAVLAFSLIGLVVVLGTLWWFRAELGFPAGDEAQSAADSARTASATERSATRASSPGSGGAAGSPTARSAATGTSGGAGTAAATSGNSRTAPDGVSLLVEATRQAWIRTTIDGRSDVGRTYGAGEKQKITAEREVSLRVGDAGAVIVSVGGGAPSPVGRDGEVVTKRFTSDDPRGTPAPSAAQTLDVQPGQAKSGDGARKDTPPPATSRSGAATASSSPFSTAPFSGRSAGAAGATAPASASARGATGEGRSQPPPSVSSDPGPEIRAELTSAAQRWLDAYYRNDAGVMGSLEARGMKVSDERLPDERLAAGLDARRAVERVTFQFVGESAIFTARMTEQASLGVQALHYVSWVSQVWIREASQWRLVDVRLLSDTKLR